MVALKYICTEIGVSCRKQSKTGFFLVDFQRDNFVGWSSMWKHIKANERKRQASIGDRRYRNREQIEMLENLGKITVV